MFGVSFEIRCIYAYIYLLIFEKNTFYAQPAIAAIEKTMAERDQEIQNIKEKMNNVEDDVFACFCEQIGVSNIRQYEERELRYEGIILLDKCYMISDLDMLKYGIYYYSRSQQERAKKRMEFDNQCNRIYNQLDFEKQRDTESML